MKSFNRISFDSGKINYDGMMRDVIGQWPRLRMAKETNNKQKTEKRGQITETEKYFKLKDKQRPKYL